MVPASVLMNQCRTQSNRELALPETRLRCWDVWHMDHRDTAHGPLPSDSTYSWTTCKGHESINGYATPLNLTQLCPPWLLASLLYCRTGDGWILLSRYMFRPQKICACDVLAKDTNLCVSLNLVVNGSVWIGRFFKPKWECEKGFWIEFSHRKA